MRSGFGHFSLDKLENVFPDASMFLHPSLLDRAGLVALWREALLAQKVLTGTSKGYRHHPQLDRFRQTRNPARAGSKTEGSISEIAGGPVLRRIDVIRESILRKLRAFIFGVPFPPG